MLRSEFDEFKYLTKTGTDIKSKYATLVDKQKESKALKRELEHKIRDAKIGEQDLIMRIVQLNLKLDKHEKKESND